MSVNRKPAAYLKLRLMEWSVKDLTDALTPAKSAVIINTSLRAIYTMRNTGIMGRERRDMLVDAVKANEQEFREQLVVMRRMGEARAAKRANKAVMSIAHTSCGSRV